MNQCPSKVNDGDSEVGYHYKLECINNLVEKQLTANLYCRLSGKYVIGTIAHVCYVLVHMCTTAYWVWYRFGPTRVPTVSCYVGDGVYTFVLRILSFVQIA